jgi:hypothetical protein
MTERAGCTSGARGHGPRKFNKITYEVYKVYVAKQCDGFNQEAQEKLNAENTAIMQHDREALKASGCKTRVLHEELNSIHILYFKKQN